MSPSQTPSGDATAAAILSLTLAPNRSLSPRGMRRVLICLALANILIAVFLFLIGAYPVPIFLGLDMAGALIAFRVLERRRLNRIERLQIDHDRIVVTRQVRGAETAVWSSAPIFTQLRIEEEDPDLPRIQVASSGRWLEIGAELGAERRRELAELLKEALQTARNGRRFEPTSPRVT